MKTVIQRVKDASVSVGGETVGAIDMGLLIYLGVEKGDDESLIEPLVKKIALLRIFRDENDRMNLSVKDVGGSILVVSQFTLCANLSKGHRPGWDYAAPPEEAERLYLLFADAFRKEGFYVATGRFGAHMAVRYENDGPVTILMNRSRTPKELI